MYANVWSVEGSYLICSYRALLSDRTLAVQRFSFLLTFSLNFNAWNFRKTIFLAFNQLTRDQCDNRTIGKHFLWNLFLFLLIYSDGKVIWMTHTFEPPKIIPQNIIALAAFSLDTNSFRNAWQHWFVGSALSCGVLRSLQEMAYAAHTQSKSWYSSFIELIKSTRIHYCFSVNRH